MEKISKNTLVSLTLKIESQTGDLLDDSEKLIYLHGGYGQIFQKLEELLDSKEVGYNFHTTLQPSDTFGEYDASLVIKEPLEELPKEIKIGMELDGEDEGIVWVVEKIEDGYVTLNANHELAGIPLVVSGEVLELQHLSDEATQEVLNMEHEH